MSCPDWTRLATGRDERSDAMPAGWQEALEHFDSCSLCRRGALAADPTLIFRRLPGATMSPAEESSEVDSVRLAVAAMRTASRLEPAPKAFAGWRRWSRWAAAAGIALATLSASGPVSVPPSVPGRPIEAAATPAALRGAVEAAPMIEGLDRPSARIYQYQADGEGIAVLMIFDESIDV